MRRGFRPAKSSPMQTRSTRRRDAAPYNTGNMLSRRRADPPVSPIPATTAPVAASVAVAAATAAPVAPTQDTNEAEEMDSETSDVATAVEIEETEEAREAVSAELLDLFGFQPVAQPPVVQQVPPSEPPPAFQDYLLYGVQVTSESRQLPVDVVNGLSSLGCNLRIDQVFCEKGPPHTCFHQPFGWSHQFQVPYRLAHVLDQHCINPENPIHPRVQHLLIRGTLSSDECVRLTLHRLLAMKSMTQHQMDPQYVCLYSTQGLTISTGSRTLRVNTAALTKPSMKSAVSEAFQLLSKGGQERYYGYVRSLGLSLDNIRKPRR